MTDAELIKVIQRAARDKVTQLNLSCQGLTSLPAAIGQLTNLSQLHLSGNQLMSLPAAIGQLTNLSRLDLSDNRLTSLPKEIGRLTNLNKLYLEGNPPSLLPPEIRHKEGKEIINFYKQKLQEGIDRLYEAKLVIVGEGGAGKTTLAKKIQNSADQLQDEVSTEGIDVTRWDFPLRDDKELRVNIWDFGGQEIYHATHQFFLTESSLRAGCR